MTIQVDPNSTAHEMPRIAALDGLRGLAILLVTVYRFAKEAFPESGRIVTGLIKSGSTGVDLFFVLSGFLVTGILLNAKARPRFFSRFYYRRALRIFPVYFSSLALFLYVLPWVLGASTLFAEANRYQLFLWTFSSNLKSCIEGVWSFGYLDHFWSLAIEEQFYLAWPIVVFLLSPKALLRFSLVAILLCIVSRTLFCITSENIVCSDLFTLFRCDGLLFGSCVAIHRHLGKDLAKWVIPASLAIGFAWLALGFVAWAGFPTLKLQTTLTALVWTTLLALVLASKPGHILTRVLESFPLRRLGKHSYAMYVIQNPLIPLMVMTGLMPIPSSSVLAGVGYVLSMSFITFVLSVVIWYAMEVWFLRLRFDSKTIGTPPISNLKSQI